MPDLLDLLADASGERSQLYCSGAPPETLASVWVDAGRAAAWFGANVGVGGSAAMTLDATSDCITALFGAWRAGVTVASLQLRGRRPAQEYSVYVAEAMASVGATTLLSDESFEGLLPAGIRTVQFSATRAQRPASATAGVHARPEFVQFSSGSTERPKGIRLTLDALAANLVAFLEIVPSDEMRLCSWLPLSHDLGLISVLAAWVACGPRWAGRGTLVLQRPSSFALNPRIWLRAWSEHQATFAAAPNFALSHAARRAPGGGVDLASMRALVVGAEPVRADSLREFERAMAPLGFDRAALCPGYGLAEATVGVTLTTPGDGWSSRTVDAHALEANEWIVGSGAGTVEVVSSGPPLPGVSVRVARPTGGMAIGEVQVQSPSAMQGYVDAGPATVAFDGEWLRTRDLGVVDDRGELFVLGRADEVLFVAGRSLHPSDIEASLARRARVPATAFAAVRYGDRYAIVVERARTRTRTNVAELCATVRAAAFDVTGLAPAVVAVVAPGTMPRTTSGKVRRSAMAGSPGVRSLELEHVQDFNSARRLATEDARRDPFEGR